MDNSSKQTTLVLICFGLMTVSAVAYYQPKEGRFLQRDSLGVNPTGSRNNTYSPLVQYWLGLSLYEYVKSNAQKYTDPQGYISGEPEIDLPPLPPSWWDPPMPPPAPNRPRSGCIADPTDIDPSRLFRNCVWKTIAKKHILLKELGTAYKVITIPDVTGCAVDDSADMEIPVAGRDMSTPYDPRTPDEVLPSFCSCLWETQKKQQEHCCKIPTSNIRIELSFSWTDGVPKLIKKEGWSFYYSCDCPNPDFRYPKPGRDGPPVIGKPVYW